MMGMAPSLFQVVTFATDLARGNPAFVLVDPGAVAEPRIAALCDTLGAGVLAVVDGAADEEPGLRFFTAEGRHPGAGHATLAAAHVVLRTGERDRVTFRMAGGEPRAARRAGARIGVAFPAMASTPIDVNAAMAEALGAGIVETRLAPFGHVAVLEDAGSVASIRPDLEKIAAFGRSAVMATARGGPACDFVIRVFAPNAGLPEDPVCGTAHRILAPYWAERLGKATLHSRHLSRRGGDLWCETAGTEVVIAGESRLVVQGTADLADPSRAPKE
jgi:predicted PhzF superfamily epimerase YddE/YHI9